MRLPAADDEGSAPAEFAMVSGLLVLLVVAVLQLALALHVRNTVIDAAAEGARYGALADRGAVDAVRRTHQLITLAVGEDYARDVTVAEGRLGDREILVVTVRATLPVFGLFGPAESWEAHGRAVVERLD